MIGVSAWHKKKGQDMPEFAETYSVKLLELCLVLRLLAKTTGLKVTTFVQTVVKHLRTHTADSVHI